MTDFIEYRVRPVTRFIVTRFHQADNGRSEGSEAFGEYGNELRAYEVMMALARSEKNPYVVYVGGNAADVPNQCLADMDGLSKGEAQQVG